MNEGLQTLFYCEHCKGICMRYDQAESQHGVRSWSYSDTGFELEGEFEASDYVDGDSWCPECTNTLTVSIKVDPRVIAELVKRWKDSPPEEVYFVRMSAKEFRELAVQAVLSAER